VRLRFGHRERLVSIMGLPEQSRLHRLVDIHRRELETPPRDLLVSQKLAELLGARPGDELTVEVLEGKRRVGTVRLAAVIRDFAGTMAYMDLAALQRLLEEGQTVSGAFLQVDASEQPELYRRLKDMPRVSVINIQRTAIDTFRRTIGENLMRMRFFNVLFSSIIAVGVVYNAARISLLESSRDLATLRVLGFSRREISVILLGELAVLTLVAVPLGCSIGYGFAWATTWAYDRELFRIPLVVSTRTYGFAAVVVLLAACGAALVVARQLRNLDLVQVLKARE
jgi:putative ABC transport system permease protein